MAAAAPGRRVTATTFDATRAELQAALAAAQRRGARDEAAAIRRRLAAGDFQAGDRVQLTLTVDSVSRSELVVRDAAGGGPVLEFAQLAPLPLTGVLNVELQPTLESYFKRYYRNPDVRAVKLVRVSISGAVGKPGVYSVAPDLPVGEVLAVAGGQAGNARVNKIEIRRGNSRLIGPKQYTEAVRDGSTLADEGVRSGDEIKVPERKTGSKLQSLSTIAFAISAFTGLIFLIRSAYNN